MDEVDWAATGLRHRWWVDLLTVRRDRIGLLDGVTSMSVSHKAGAAVRGSGKLDVTLRRDADFLGLMARVWVEVTDPAGRQHTSPLITGFLDYDASSVDITESMQLQIRDTTARLDPKLGVPLTVPAGTLVTGQIRTLLTQIGVDAPAITESSATTSIDYLFKADETYRSVISTLADIAGFAAAYADVWGTIHLDPYVLPRDRPVVGEFARGRTSTMVPAWKTARDIAGIPNHLVRISKSDGETPAMVSELWDTDPASRWSTVSRGMVIADVEGEIDAADQETLDARAARDWALARQSVRTFTVGGRWRPLALGDRIRFAPGPRRLGAIMAPGLDTTVTVQGIDITAAAGAPLGTVQYSLEEVSDGQPS